jgi:hypothetical protein
MPFVLDGTRFIKGRITVGSYKSLPGSLLSPGAGQARLRLVLTGTSRGKTKTLGDQIVEYMVTPDKNSYTFDFRFPAVAKLHRTSFDSLVLTTTMRGAVLLHGSYRLDMPASFITIRQLVRR